MELIAIDALAAQRAALEAPEGARIERFRELVMRPLAPFWEPFLGWGPQAAADAEVEPALRAARRFGFYSPEQEIEAGLAALDRFAEAGTWRECVAALEEAWAALAPEAHGIALPEVRYTLLLGDPAKLDPKLGSYTGVGGWPGRVLAIAWPNDFNLPRLAAVTAHELHHNVRFSYEPFVPHDVTVGQYIVAEGLAEAFAAELHGEDTLGRGSAPSMTSSSRRRCPVSARRSISAASISCAATSSAIGPRRVRAIRRKGSPTSPGTASAIGSCAPT